MSERKVERLQSLNERETTILNFIMTNKNTKVIDIAKNLNLAESTTRNTLSAIFTKLGVPEDEVDKRGYVIREYGDIYQTIKETQTPSETSASQSDTPRPELSEPSEIPKQSNTSPRVNVAPPNRRMRPMWIVVGVLGGFLCISVVVIVFLLSIIRNLNQDRINPASVVVPTQPIVQVIVSTTPEPLIPTLIPTKEPTVTLEPSITPTSTNTLTITPTSTSIPIITLPYKADFSRGLGQEWSAISGNWYVKNNSLSVIPPEDIKGWIFINDPTLKNYRLKLKVNIPKMYSGGQGEVIILVRYDSAREDQIGLLIPAFIGGKFAIWSNINKFVKNAIIDGIDFSGDSTYVIEAVDSTFTIYIDGQLVGSIVMDGFEKGGIGLGIDCSSSDNCPSVNSLSIEPLP